MARAKKEEPSLDEDKLEEEHPDPKTDDEDAEPALDEEEDKEPEAPQEFAPAPSPQPAAALPLSAHAPMGSKASAMKARLAGQPKVRVFIPLAPGEKQGVTQSVILNGYPMYIRKGTYVDVPQAVAEVLETKLKHKMSIENHPSRISGDGTVQMTTYGN